MNVFRRLTVSLLYFHHAPWDSGIVPPEVAEFIATHPPGRVLDLGCGTGTSCLAFARAGWQVSGVDHVRGAIRIAKQIASRQNLRVEFLVGDVTRLPSSVLATPRSLILDIGCYHSLSPSGKQIYLAQLPRLLESGGTWLLYGFLKIPQDKVPGTPGLHTGDLEQAQSHLNLVKRQDGTDRHRTSAWFWFEKK